MASPWSVTANADDGYWSITFSDFNNTGTTLLAGIASSGPYNGFQRFQAVDIPQGATITSAFLRLNSAGVAGSGTILWKIRAEAADDPAAPTTAGDANGRTKTTAGVDWDFTTGSWGSGASKDSPDISAVIQEVVNRAGWASGNDMTIYVLDDGTGGGSGTIYAQWQALENAGTAEPELHVTWTTAAPVTGWGPIPI